jgi:hypothetical protein
MAATCPDGLYRGCDFMGCEGMLRICPTFPCCPHPAPTATDCHQIAHMAASRVAGAQGYPDRGS